MEHLSANRASWFSLVPYDVAYQARFIKVPWLPFGAKGLTLGRYVLLVMGLHRSPDELIAHELVHVYQYRRNGPWTFLWRYVSDYLMLRKLGNGHRKSYLLIGYEAEARSAVTNWRASLGIKHWVLRKPTNCV